MSQSPINNIAILGSGISGLAAALSLTFLPTPIPFTLYELRPVLSSIGGAVGLSPNALRYLDRLGILSKLKWKGLGCETDGIEIFSVHSGRKMGEISFLGMPDGYKGRRVMRKDLLEGMLETLQERMRDSGVGQVVYGKKAVSFAEVGTQVEITFEDGTTAMRGMVLGCDGIHSAARMAFVEPERKPGYSGIAAAYGIASAENLASPLHFETSGLNSSRQGSLLTSFCDADRKQMYVAAVMETEEQFSREGWRAKGEDQEHVRKGIMDRFKGGVFPVVEELIDKTEDWFLYPVYKLSPKGRWCRGKVMLLGDAAHAMPPQGESVGLALEDVVLFMRIFARYKDESLDKVFETYEALRRSRIDHAYAEANYRWESVKDAGWFGNWMKEFITPFYLWWTNGQRSEGFKFDVGSIEMVD